MFYPRFNRTKDAEAKSNIVSSKHNNVCYDVSQESISGKFDPTALERGAAALRYLDGSPHASKAFEITKLQELTKQAELKNEMEKLHSAQSKLQLERAQIEAQERRKTMMKQQEQERITAQYKAQLEAEAYAKKLRDQQDQNERCLRQQHEQFLRQENIRKQTENEILKAKLEHKRLETQHEKDLIKTKIHEETRGKILQERENVDIHFRELKLKASEQRQTQLESIKTTLSSLGKACTNLLEDKKKLTAMVKKLKLPLLFSCLSIYLNQVTGFTGLALGIYGAKATTQVAGRYIV
jgi:ATPase family AAA domain-containing protein 3A/B